MLYLLYTAEVFHVIADCGLVGHSYTDNTQTCISVPATNAPVAVQLMGRNQLKLNQTKCRISGSAHVSSWASEYSRVYNNIGRGPLFYNISDHVVHVCRSRYFHLRHLRQIRYTLKSDAVKALVHKLSLEAVGLLQQSSDRYKRRYAEEIAVSPKRCCSFDKNTLEFDNITHVLLDLHWLPVCQQIVFKTTMLVYKCLRGLAPSYLVEFWWPVTKSSRPSTATVCYHERPSYSKNTEVHRQPKFHSRRSSHKKHIVLF